MDSRQLLTALDKAAVDPKNTDGAVRQRISVLRGLALAGRSRGLTLAHQYRIATLSPDAVAEGSRFTWRERRRLVPMLSDSLRHVLDADLPSMGTPLPAGVDGWFDTAPVEVKHVISIATGAPREGPAGDRVVDGKRLEDIAAKAGLAWTAAMIYSAHPKHGIRRSPFTKQVLIDKDAYQLLLAGALIESADAGPRSVNGPLIQRALRTACKRISVRPEAMAGQTFQICALAEGTY
jgi:hypothetical protein